MRYDTECECGARLPLIRAKGTNVFVGECKECGRCVTIEADADSLKEALGEV